MENQEIIEMLNELNNNLRGNCCGNTLTPLVMNNNFEGKLHIKLYDKICDACQENNNYELYPIGTIINLNNQVNRNVGIKCNSCIKKGCNIKGCVISLRTNRRQHTRFARMERIEIIYI